MEKLIVGLEWFLNPDHLPLILGIEKGWFKEEALEIEMIEPEKHFDALEEIENNSMDIAITEPIHLVEDKATNQNVVGFARYLHTNGGVMYNKDKGIKTPKDLVGKRLQYPGAPGLGGIAIAKTMIEADSVTYKEGDITPVNNSFYHTDALLNDKADAATLIFENFEILEAKSKGLNVDYFALKDYNVPDFCQLIFITSPNKLKADKEKINKFLKVIKKAIQYINTHLKEVVDVYATYTQTDISNQLNKDTIIATTKCFTNDLSMSPEFYDDLQLWLKENGKIETTIDANEYFNNHLLFNRTSK
ncbi:ABC transporter substrate-binding protein [Staphylococcus haemolyticus]|uniref:ABC transporter substrate-binding protein n=1 Tax=Staphylococcus haemolyticus TaxID=1283 RepID=UPI002B23F504|nr:ABC transporter substrate-binding protein [Staphylococcus haemolyticus]MEB2655429.1 ABC transporter substrate-binding protein [Staphylococcus haemolyticus]